MSDLFPFTPEELGLPPKFKRFRRQQEEALAQYQDAQVKFVEAALPPGAGKSLFAMTIPALTDKRTCILTATNGLSEQYMEDFASTGLVQIKGRANYKCTEHTLLQCDQGMKHKCRASFSGECPYRNAYDKACQSQRVITNYDYFVAINLYGDGLGKFGVIVLDEAHDAPEKICSAAAIEFTAGDVYQALDFRWPLAEFITKMASWDSWARAARAVAQKRLTKYDSKIGTAGKSVLAWFELEEYERLIDVSQRLDAFMNRKGEWGLEATKGGYYFEPLWARDYAAEYVFRYAERIVLQSATLTKKSSELMGIDPNESSFKEYPAVFLASHSPLFYLDNSPAISYNSPPHDLTMLYANMDSVIRYDRGDIKGIAHSVSHPRARDILEASEFKAWMVTNSEGESILDILEQFRTSDPPRILVSPSVTTGYDFPGKQAQYQLLPKAFIPNTNTPIMKLRAEQDKDYADHRTAQTLVQACGRADRYEDDYCENWALDRLIWSKIWQKRYLYPEYFKKKCKKLSSIQPPKRKLK